MERAKRFAQGSSKSRPIVLSGFNYANEMAHRRITGPKIHFRSRGRKYTRSDFSQSFHYHLAIIIPLFSNIILEFRISTNQNTSRVSFNQEEEEKRSSRKCYLISARETFFFHPSGEIFASGNVV